MSAGTAPASGSPVVALTGDLMDRSRITARHRSARFVGDGAALVAAVAGLPAGGQVFVDLGRPGALDAIASLASDVARGVRVIAYGSHVDTGLLEEAAARGATEVLARSVFFRRLQGGG